MRQSFPLEMNELTLYQPVPFNLPTKSIIPCLPKSHVPHLRIRCFQRVIHSININSFFAWPILCLKNNSWWSICATQIIRQSRGKRMKHQPSREWHSFVSKCEQQYWMSKLIYGRLVIFNLLCLCFLPKIEIGSQHQIDSMRWGRSNVCPFIIRYLAKCETFRCMELLL